MNKRQRGRGRRPNNNNSNNNPNRSLDSHGPDIRVRGSAQTIYDKYITLARDARTGGSRVKAENYLQHAEHYLRLVQEQRVRAQAHAEQQQAKAQAHAERQQKHQQRKSQQNADTNVQAENVEQGDDTPRSEKDLDTPEENGQAQEAEAKNEGAAPEAVEAKPKRRARRKKPTPDADTKGDAEAPAAE